MTGFGASPAGPVHAHRDRTGRAGDLAVGHRRELDPARQHRRVHQRPDRVRIGVGGELGDAERLDHVDDDLGLGIEWHPVTPDLLKPSVGGVSLAQPRRQRAQRPAAVRERLLLGQRHLGEGPAPPAGGHEHRVVPEALGARAARPRSRPRRRRRPSSSEPSAPASTSTVRNRAVRALRIAFAISATSFSTLSA